MFNQFKRIISDKVILFKKPYLSFSQKFLISCNYSKIVFKRFLDGKVTTFKKEKFLGFKVSFDSYNDFFWTFREIFVLGDYYFKTDSEVPVCIDCGGNIGITTLYFKYIYPNSKVYTFEAEPHNVDLINKNIKDSKIEGVTVIGKAVGKEKGTLTFHGANRMGSIVEEFYKEKKEIQLQKGRAEIENKIEVEVVPLSEYMTEPHYDVLKLDIEGVEADVLREIDSKGLLGKVDQVILEYHRFSFEKNKLTDIINIFERNHSSLFFDSPENDIAEASNKKNQTFMIYASINAHKIL